MFGDLNFAKTLSKPRETSSKCVMVRASLMCCTEVPGPEPPCGTADGDADGGGEELVKSMGKTGAIEVVAHSCGFIGLHQRRKVSNFVL